MKGSGIISAYHTQRVAPLMSRVLPLYLMAPRASLDGMALTKGALSSFEVAQCIKEAMEPSRDDASAILDFVYPVPGHPQCGRNQGTSTSQVLFPCASFLLELPTP